MLPEPHLVCLIKRSQTICLKIQHNFLCSCQTVHSDSGSKRISVQNIPVRRHVPGEIRFGLQRRLISAVFFPPFSSTRKRFKVLILDSAFPSSRTSLRPLELKYPSLTSHRIRLPFRFKVFC